MSDDIQKLIDEYSHKLMKMKQDSVCDLPLAKEPVKEPVNETVRQSDSCIIADESVLQDSNSLPVAATQDESQQLPESPEELTGTATFACEVNSANEAFPISSAKILLSRDNELITFLMSDNTGKTKSVIIASPPEENSLEPFNPNREAIYTAEVYADSFVTQKDIFVSAVGGTQIILQTELTPVSERVN